uniref:Uncharacterized protein n=1 Tax=Acrobeloides nanus TaxID=290746 RepID=A0A914D2V1_9BILA
GSTWVLQARRMDGRIGPITVLPDQINTVNPLIIILMVPVFEAWIYPAARKVVKVTPLRKMAFGGILAAVAFIMAGFVQLKVNDTMEPKPNFGSVFIQRYGNATGPITLNGTDLPESKSEHPSGIYSLQAGDHNFELNLTNPQGAYVLGLFSNPDKSTTSMTIFPYACEKSENGRTRVYLLLSNDSYLVGGNLFVLDNEGVLQWNITIKPGAYVDIQPPIISSPDYTIKYGKNCTRPEDCPYQKLQEVLEIVKKRFLTILF